jgi:hypothetical protein
VLCIVDELPKTSHLVDHVDFVQEVVAVCRSEPRNLAAAFKRINFTTHDLVREPHCFFNGHFARRALYRGCCFPSSISRHVSTLTRLAAPHLLRPGSNSSSPAFALRTLSRGSPGSLQAVPNRLRQVNESLPSRSRHVSRHRCRLLSCVRGCAARRSMTSSACQVSIDYLRGLPFSWTVCSAKPNAQSNGPHEVENESVRALPPANLPF